MTRKNADDNMHDWLVSLDAQTETNTELSEETLWAELNEGTIE